jgi:hypothetical protein
VLTDTARNDVGGAARRKGHNDFDGFSRILLSVLRLSGQDEAEYPS